MDDQVAAAMQQAGQGAFPPPGGMGPPAQPPAPPMPPPGPPVTPGGPIAPTPTPEAPGPPPAPPPSAEVVPSPAPELETENPEEIDDELGSGAHPRQSGTTVRMKEHPLDRAANIISEEIKGQSKQLASELFPSGPAGTERLSKPAFDAYVKRHWDDQTFRQSLLDRMAPKGPDGKRLASGVKQFNQMYREVVEPARRVKETSDQPAFIPPGHASPQAPPSTAPGPMASTMPFQPPLPPPMSGGPEAGGTPPPGPNVLPPG